MNKTIKLASDNMKTHLALNIYQMTTWNQFGNG